MYRYNFECEKIILEIVDNLVSINELEFKMNIIITEDNLLLFKNVKEESILKAKGINELPDYELIVKIKLEDIDYEIDGNHTIIKLGNDEIILYDFDLNKLKTSLFCDDFVIY